MDSSLRLYDNYLVQGGEIWHLLTVHVVKPVFEDHKFTEALLPGTLEKILNHSLTSQLTNIMLPLPWILTPSSNAGSIYISWIARPLMHEPDLNEAMKQILSLSTL